MRLRLIHRWHAKSEEKEKADDGNNNSVTRTKRTITSDFITNRRGVASAAKRFIVCVWVYLCVSLCVHVCSCVFSLYSHTGVTFSMCINTSKEGTKWSRSHTCFCVACAVNGATEVRCNFPFIFLLFPPTHAIQGHFIFFSFIFIFSSSDWIGDSKEEF